MSAELLSEVGPVVLAGADTIVRLPECLQPDTDGVVLVCDTGVVAAGLVEPVTARLDSVTRVERFVAPPGEPAATTIDAGAAVARRFHRPTVIGLGGGTALDIAKLVAALQPVEGSVAEYALGARTFARRAPAVMVPTTAGTGSEVTATAIFSDAAGRKLWVWSPALPPDAVLLDPGLSVSLPPGVTVATGLDAFAHALEAVSGQSTGPAVERPAVRAIELTTANLITAVREPENLEARLRMQEAALLAGAAIDNGGTGMAHNIGHALGTCHHVPHGIAVALGLAATLEWSIEGVPGRFGAAADAFAGGIPVDELADRYSAWLDELGFAGVAATALPAALDGEAVARAMAAGENAPMADNSARPPSAGELAELAGRCAALCGRYAASTELPP